MVEAGGGEIVTGADVKEIIVKNGRATGVKLADGRTINGSKFVASAIDFPTTVQMAGEELFPEPVREKAKSWHWGNHSLVTLHLALKDPPAYRAAAFDPDVARAYNIFFGMDHIDDVASCFEDCAAKKFPRVLMGNGACNSLFDPSYAPAGRHAAFWWPFAPYSVDGGPQEWERNRADYTQRVLDYWRIYASNLEGDNLLGNLSVHAARRRKAQCQYASGCRARRRLCPEPARHQPAASADARLSHAGGRRSISAVRRRATAAASMARPAISPPMPSSTICRLKRTWKPVAAPEWKH